VSEVLKNLNSVIRVEKVTYQKQKNRNWLVKNKELLQFRWINNSYWGELWCNLSI